MYENFTDVCHYWPGITPFNIWQLPYDMWLRLLAGLKHIKEQQEAR